MKKKNSLVTEALVFVKVWLATGFILGVGVGVAISALNHLFLSVKEHLAITIGSAVIYGGLYAGLSVFPLLFFIVLSRFSKEKISVAASAFPAAAGFFVFSYIFAYAADLNGYEATNPSQKLVYIVSPVAGLLLFLVTGSILKRVKIRLSLPLYFILLVVLAVAGLAGGRIWHSGAEKKIADIRRSQKVNLHDTGLKVIFVGWDSANFEAMNPLLEEGKLPNVKRMITEGSTGGLVPDALTISPMLWTTMLTGKTPVEHSIRDFWGMTLKGFPAVEKLPGNLGLRKILGLLEKSKLVDLIEYLPIAGYNRDEKTIFKILSENKRTVGATGWWPSWPAEKVNGYLVSDRAIYLGEEDAVNTGMTYPPGLMKDLNRFIVHPDSLSENLPDFMHLYSPEEAAPLAKLGDNEPERFMHFLKKLSRDYSYYRMFSYMAENQSYDLSALYLKTIDDAGHLFTRYQQPGYDWWKKPDPEMKRVGDIVGQLYMLHDLWLGEILSRADENTVVILCSDHGMQPSNRDAPEITGIHSQKGIIIMMGGPVKKGYKLQDNTHYEIAPTILYLLGLPVPEDMGGKIITEALNPGFLEKFPPEHVQTYKTHVRDKVEFMNRNMSIENEELNGLKNLGYIE